LPDVDSGEIRLIAFHGMPALQTLTVTTGPSNPELGTINLAEAQALIADRSARWIGEEPQIPAAPTPEQVETTPAAEW
jgi:hypothetical protein